MTDIINVMAHKLATTLKTKNPSHSVSAAVAQYSLAIILNTVFIIVLTLSISLVLGTFKETAIVLFAFAGLRAISGGLHVKSGMACVLYSTAGALLLPYAAEWITDTLALIINTISILLFMILAPSNIRTKFPNKYYPLLKIVSLLIVISNFYTLSSLLAITFFIQALSLLGGGDNTEKIK